jgi:GMP synthase-like glutamine amidotransferase
MRAVCLQHVAFEGPGAFTRLLEKHGYRIERRIVPKEGLPPDPGDFLLVMGGPMSVNDPDPWIAEELTFIRKTVEAGMPFIGICLGSQLLAKALGAKVYPGPKLEVGMTPIRLTQEGRKDPVFGRLVEPIQVFEWHGEVFDQPTDAVPLAVNDVCLQAFRYGTRAYGLLFHPELDRPGIEALCRECPGDLSRAKLDAGHVMKEADPQLPRLHAWAQALIDHLTSTGR